MYSAIEKTLFKFANSFDTKDWQGLAETLADHIDCDYDLRNEDTRYSRQDYIALRQESLQSLNTQHLFSNMEITLHEATAHVRVNAYIMRCNQQQQYFHTHALYTFTLNNTDSTLWQIIKIKQQVMWNEGDYRIHSGVKL